MMTSWPLNTIIHNYSILKPLLYHWTILASTSDVVIVLHCHLLIHAEIHIYILDTYRRNDNRRKNKGRMIKTQEDFFRKIFTSHFIARVRKGCSKFACERVLETEHKLHILTPLLWPSRCVFLVLLILGYTPSGLSEGPLGRVWLSLPHLVSTLWKSAGHCSGTQTQLS